MRLIDADALLESFNRKRTFLVTNTMIRTLKFDAARNAVQKEVAGC